MSNDRFDVLDRLAPLFEAPEPSFEAFLRRRDRKRRNQRIAAGVVGIAVFVVAVWIVMSVGSFDRTQTPAVPGGAETGPEVSGPTSTDPSVAPDADWMFSGIPGLPPEGMPLSTPVEGELVAHYDAIQGAGFVFVYADGRVIFQGGGVGNSGRNGIYERRLTPEGVELVRSGAVKAERFQLSSTPVPADVWVDPEARPYVPARYAICGLDPARLGTLPPRAAALLRGKARHDTCFEVTTEEARALDDILSESTDITFRQLLPHGKPFPPMA
jgi:hypothetical protein